MATKRRRGSCRLLGAADAAQTGGYNHVHDNNGGGAQTAGTIGSLPPI